MMEHLTSLLARLPHRHRLALNWFIKYAGTDQGWPGSLSDGTLIVSKAKGIYKPNWTKYALSVRQSLVSPYPDREPVLRRDGTWSYLYFQENTNPQMRDSEYTNRGMVACWNDRVPIGVIRQITGKPDPRYRILGAALVSGWEGGYFFLEGFSGNGQSHGRGPQAQTDTALIAAEEAYEASRMFEPQSITDARERISASIVVRRGQAEFRRRLLEAYGTKCAITGCDVEDALEAAHIVPYRGPQTNHLSNGLLLRADIHTLFELGLLAIDTLSMTMILAPRLEGTTYSSLAGRPLAIPEDMAVRPSKEALDYHREWSGL